MDSDSQYAETVMQEIDQTDEEIGDEVNGPTFLVKCIRRADSVVESLYARIRGTPHRQGTKSGEARGSLPFEAILIGFEEPYRGSCRCCVTECVGRGLCILSPH